MRINKSIKLLTLSVVLTSALNAGGIKFSDAEVEQMNKEKRRHQLVTLQLVTNSEKLQNDQLILAQKIHDLEQAFNKLECTHCKTPFDRKAFNKQNNPAKYVTMKIEPDVYVENTEGDYGSQEIRKVKNEEEGKKPLNGYEALLNELNNENISKEQRKAYLDAYLKNHAVEQNKTQQAKKVKSRAEASNVDFWLLLDKDNIEHKVKVMSKTLNIRELPSTNSKVVGTYTAGEEVTFTGVARPLATDGSLWLKTDKGYIFAALTNFKEVVKLNTKALKEKL